MAGLLFGMPEGISDDLQQTIAAIQTWAGKADGMGKWTHVVVDNSFLSVLGAGNSWTLGNLTNQYSYTIIGNTMILSWYFTAAQLTIATGVGDLFLLIPDGYQVIPTIGDNGQYHASVGWMVNGGTYATVAARSGVGPNGADTQRIDLVKLNTGAPNYVTDTSFLIAGQLAFEIAPRT